MHKSFSLMAVALVSLAASRALSPSICAQTSESGAGRGRSRLDAYKANIHARRFVAAVAIVQCKEGDPGTAIRILATRSAPQRRR